MSREQDTVLPSWAVTLDANQRAELLAYMAARELCACGHRDDQHGPDSDCLACPTEGGCIAWNPVQS